MGSNKNYSINKRDGIQGIIFKFYIRLYKLLFDKYQLLRQNAHDLNWFYNFSKLFILTTN